MKRLAKTLFVALTVVAGSGLAVSAQVPELSTGVGPAVAGSYNPNKLPDDALDFLRTYYGDHYAQSCEKQYDTESYEVVMTDGTEVEFNERGRVIEIEAPDNAVIAADAVKSVVNSRVYNRLKSLGVEGKVEKIDREKRGYDIELSGNGSMTELFIAHDGKLLARK